MSQTQVHQTFTDHLGRVVSIPVPPQRIVSLCPSQTETLVHLGVGARLVGRTSFCIHPAEELADVVVVGGTKTLKLERVIDLEPDLVICEKEENTQEMVEELSKLYPTFVTDVRDWFDGIRMIRDLGAITGTAARAEELAQQAAAAMGGIVPLSPERTALYLIWKSPLMAVGADTYIHSVMELCGFKNLAARLPGRYPELTAGQIRQMQPDYLLLSTEPFHFTRDHVTEMQAEMHGTKVILVDGEMFTWYGSRMIEAPTYLQRLVEAVKA
jgi:ABC-type Fe3+-hydroxamate transport system substrate-binding protein